VALEHRDGRVYFYQSRRDGKRVWKEYVGAGRVAELAAALEAENRAEAAAKASESQKAIAELAALDAALAPLIELADTLTAAALVAAGYHRHHHGPWRKRRA